MIDSNNVNPNLIPPPREPDVVARGKRSGKNQNSALKNKNKHTGVHKSVSFKKGIQKLGSKGNKSVEGMEGVEFDGNESEGFDGDVGSSVDAQSVDSRSVEEPDFEKGEVLNDVSTNDKVNAAYSFNNVEKWPSLGSTSKEINVCGAKSNIDRVKVMNDTLMKESSSPTKPQSFAKAVQGLRITTSMCEKAYGRASFARVLVEVDASKGLIDNVEVSYRSLGRSMRLKVEYPWSPPVCSYCKVFGHSFEKLNVRPRTDDEKKLEEEKTVVKAANVVVNELNGNEWQTVNYRRNGSYDNRFGRNNGNQAALVKKDSDFKMNTAKSSQANDKGKSKMDIDSNGVNNSGNVIVSENKFAALDKEQETEMSNDVDTMKASVDEDMVKKTNVDSLKMKILNYEKQIKFSNNNIAMSSKAKADSMYEAIMVEYGLTENQASGKVYDEVYRDELDRIKELCVKKQLAEVEFFFKTSQVFTLNELESWTEEMLEFYKSTIGEEAFEKMKEQIKNEVTDEVADTSGCAQFIAKDIRLKHMANMDNTSYVWASAISGLRNIRKFAQKERTVEALYNVVIDNVRFKLLGLGLKSTSEVIKAGKVNWFNDGTGFWGCNFIYEYFEMDKDDDWKGWMVICKLWFVMAVVVWGGLGEGCTLFLPKVFSLWVLLWGFDFIASLERFFLGSGGLDVADM
ncbi:hypothetical protein CTI12_AA039860 [Artemisia annua]|uniref:Zinc knuckle CX2CX4HX4C n=1 Tax=Artemisia annua TaxID=35608 RepID=A0A2U1QE97_ARTAN|nr:hypothetical protein CTI12_AA039860 [Artemisia annua]